MSYTIDTVSNSSVVVDDEYERRSLDDQGWEFTDRPVLLAPEADATGVSLTRVFEWAEYVKDIPIENPVYKLEVVEIATKGTTPDWTSPFKWVTTETSANLREALEPGNVYAWRLFAFDRVKPESFIDTYERASLGADYEDNTIQGTGSSSIVNDELVIELDATSETSRQSLRLLKNFENPNTLIKGIKFSNTTSDFQTVIYFNEQGTIQNNQMNGYYFYPLGDEIRMGKSVNYSPSDKNIATIPRTDDVPYNMRFHTTNGHVRITLWDPATESEPSPQLDWEDNNSPYISGGITFIPVAFGDAQIETLTIDDIEVTFAEGEVTEITSVTLDGSTSDITEGNTRSFTATAEGTGNVQQSFNWSATGGTLTEDGGANATFTADSGSGSCSVTAESTQDDTQSDTLNFDRVEAPTSGYLNDTEGDESALETMSQNMSGFDSSWDLPISLSNPPNGVTVENGRVKDLDVEGLGLTGSVSNNINNLQQMEYYRLLGNNLGGNLPVFNLPSIIYLYLNFSGNKGTMDPHLQDQDGGQDVHNGKDDDSGFTAYNKFTGDLSIENAPNLEWLACTWTELEWVQDNVFDWPLMKGLWLSYAQGMAGKAKEVPSTIGNMTGLRHLGLTCTETGNPFKDQWGGVLPANMSNLTDLKAVRFARNESFTGAFPDLSDCLNMRVVQLSFTRFTSGWPGYFLRKNDPYPLQTFAASWCGNSWTDAYLPDPVNDSLKSMNLGGIGLTGHITSTQISRQVSVHEMSSNNITSIDEDFTRLSNIRNFRWSNNNISGNLSKCDWLQPYDKLRKLSRATFNGNNYTSSDWDMLEDGREYDISDNKVQSSSDSNPIVQKTRREWWEYHCDPNGPLAGVDGKASQFSI